MALKKPEWPVGPEFEDEDDFLGTAWGVVPVVPGIMILVAVILALLFWG